jgi:hypothetical protein
MSRKARKDASLNYINLSFAFIALGLLSVTAILPYWTIFPPNFDDSWIKRNIGLLKLSGKFTNMMMTGADVTWIALRDSVCGASAAWTTGFGSSSGQGMASALGNAMMGVTCSQTCKDHISTRCTWYYQAVYVYFAVFGLLIGGALTTLVGAAMPMIGKERKKDRVVWLLVDVVGFLMVVGALATYHFFSTAMYSTFRTTSWFQLDSTGWCFYVAAVSGCFLLIPIMIQTKKVMAEATPKPGAGPDQLLTSGASPDFLMPSAI